MADENPNEVWVAMYHPDLDMDQAVVVTRAAFDEAWEAKGWKATGASHVDMDRVDTAIKRTAAKAPEKKEA